MRSLGVDMDDKDNVSAWRWPWDTYGSALGHQALRNPGLAELLTEERRTWSMCVERHWKCWLRAERARPTTVRGPLGIVQGTQLQGPCWWCRGHFQPPVLFPREELRDALLTPCGPEHGAASVHFLCGVWFFWFWVFFSPFCQFFILFMPTSFSISG